MGSPKPKTKIPAQRPKPFNKQRPGRAGNYSQEVDTEGMDPAMKATLGIQRKNKKTGR